jgi:actin-like ATPase involved in cell morphogenesis
MSDRLYVGIDLGTYQSTIASSAGKMHTIETVVGRPKDPVARNFLGRDVLFGEDALKNKLACNLYRPMAAGVTQDDEANLASAKAFVSHLLETVDPEEFDEVLGVICSPSHVSFTDKSNLVATLRGQVNAIMVVTEPFATAYGIDEIAGSIVVDIGAGTTDIARVYGTFPTDEDQVTITEAGDWLDLQLMELIRKKYTGAQVTKDMVRKWKEASSYVGGDVREVTVELSVLCSESVSKTFEISGKQNFSSLNPKFGVLLRDWDGNGVYPVSGEDYSIDDDGWSGGAGGFKTFAVEYLNEFSAPASNKYAQIYAKFDAVQWYLGAHSIDLLSFQDYLPTENTDSLYLNFFSSSDGGINTGSQVAFKDGDNKSYLGLEQINWTGWKHLSYRFSGLTTNSGDSLKTTDLTAFVLQLGAAPEKSKELMVRYDFILITHGEPLFSE